jgi:Zn finger protein HypA/HybF involved in hydrogenase expression
MSDAPIEPQEYLYGVKVVQIEDLRVARGLTRRPLSSCKHKKLVYDDKERRVWCSDCETEVEPFDAFMQLVGVFSSAKSKIDRRMQELAEAEKFAMRSRAAKRMDEYWRSQTMAPLCPHCNGAILPEDVVNGLAQTSKSIEIAARKRKQSARLTP